jgi:hypothetical protein
MAHGYFTIEEWRGKKKQWVAVCHLNGDQTVADALRELERRDKPGLFRVVQMQRMVWAEKIDGKPRLRKWHANSPDTLSRTAEAFDRDGGRWPSP